MPKVFADHSVSLGGFSTEPNVGVDNGMATVARRSTSGFHDDGKTGHRGDPPFHRPFEQTGVNVADDALARERIVQAAVKATEDLRTGGSATISFPFLTADARGPKHFSVRFKRTRDSTFELQR